MRPSESYPTLREQVRDVLLAAGFKAREDTLPTYSSKGTFDLTAGAGVLVRVTWWDSSDEERRALLEQMATAVRAAGFMTEGRGDRIYVARLARASSAGTTKEVKQGAGRVATG